MPEPHPGDQLRSRMYADRQFMADIRRGYDEGLRGEGVDADQYFRERFGGQSEGLARKGAWH